MSSPAPHILTVFATGTAALTCPHPAAECPAAVASSGWLTDVVDCLDLDPGTYHVWPTGDDDRPALLFSAPPGGAP